MWKQRLIYIYMGMDNSSHAKIAGSVPYHHVTLQNMACPGSPNADLNQTWHLRMLAQCLSSYNAFASWFNLIISVIACVLLVVVRS